MGYDVHLDVYDGPFDLLLRLITAEEVDLYEVKLSVIVDGFLAELSRLEHPDLNVATEFLLIAATLVELKCRRLLPGVEDVDLDEELSLFEARDYLLARLVENRTFQGAAAALLATEHLASRSLPRRAGPDERFTDLEPDLLAGVTPEMLLARARAALAERPTPSVDLRHVSVDEVSVGAMLDDLLGRLPNMGRTTLRALTVEMPTTSAVVACFLAILELFKRELVDLFQQATFGELAIIWTGDADAAAGDEIADVDDYDQTDTDLVHPLGQL
jgi:segregation and condensation protein A